MPGWYDSILEKGESGYTIHKNKCQMNHKSNVKKNEIMQIQLGNRINFFMWGKLYSWLQ